MRTLTRSTICLLTTTTLCLLSSPSSSEETKLPPELRGKATILKKGARAKSGGILLARATLLSLMKTLERRARAAEASAARAKRDARAEVAAARKVVAVELVAARALYVACRGDLLRRENLYEGALKRCAGPTPAWKWYLASGIGAAVAGGLCVGAVAASK
jgi:hypothetical protein